jgi:hypothetical protein
MIHDVQSNKKIVFVVYVRSIKFYVVEKIGVSSAICKLSDNSACFSRLDWLFVIALLPNLERFCFVRFTRGCAGSKVERKTLSNLTHLLSESREYSYIINVCCILSYFKFRTHYKPCTRSQNSAYCTAYTPLGLRIYKLLSGKIIYL